MLSNNFGISEEYDQQASNRDTDIHQNMCWSLCDSGSKLATERADEILFNCLKGDRIQVQHSTEEGAHMSLIVSRHIYGGILIAADARSTARANGQFIVVTDAYEKIIPVGSPAVNGHKFLHPLAGNTATSPTHRFIKIVT